jgi:hypothetical protein
VRSTFDALRSIRRYMSAILGDAWEVRGDNEQGTGRPPLALITRVGPTATAGSAHVVDMGMTVRIACYQGSFDSVELAQEAAFNVEEVLLRALRLEGGGDMLRPTGLAVDVDTGGDLAADTYAYQVTARPYLGETLPTAAVNAVVAANGGVVTISWDPLPGARAYYVYRDGFGVGIVPAATSPVFLDTGITPNTNRPVPDESSATVGAPGRIPLYDYAQVGLDAAADDYANRSQVGDYLLVDDVTITHLDEPDNPREIAVLCNLRVSWKRTALWPSQTPVAASASLGIQPR